MTFLEGQEKEIYLKGAPISEGIAIGVLVFLEQESDRIPDFPISTGEVEGEINRYRNALSSSRADLKKLQEDLSEEGSKEVALIIGTHIQMLDDPLMTTHMETKIREMLKNTEAVVNTVMGEYEKRFNQATTDAFFKQRLLDIKDLSLRVLNKLCASQKTSLETISPNSIVFTKELKPSYTASTPYSKIGAFVTEDGGGTSHAAIIARAKGIPYVSNINLDLLHQAEGRPVIVDGLTGDIIINPTKKTLDKYQKLRNRLTAYYDDLEKDHSLPAETYDGLRIHLYANINTANDIDQLFHHGGEGVGLFRSEYLFMRDSSLLFDEERQYLIYRKMFRKIQGLSLTFRVLDLGGDKEIPYFSEMLKEPNPVLGCRGIRFLLRRKDILTTQLQALIRAAAGHRIQILLPIISDVEEFREVKNLILSIQNELKIKGVEHQQNLPIGCMLEVPSAILICDILAQESDFLSLGTNDLIQYTLGIDRNNPGMSDFYYPTHPGIIRMIKMTILEAKRCQKTVTICGEIASNPLFTPLLIGLGVEHFSCASRFIPLIKRTIRYLSIVQCYKIAEHILSLKTSSEIASYLNTCLQNKPYLDD